MIGELGILVQKELFDVICSTPYSLAVDEGTTKSNECYLSINVRFFESPEDELTTTTTKLLSLLKMDDDSTGLGLFKKLDSFLNSGLDGQNRRKCLVGIVSNHASYDQFQGGAGLTNRLNDSCPSIEATYD